MVVLSPRKTVDAFMKLHDLPPDAFGPRPHPAAERHQRHCQGTGAGGRQARPATCKVGTVRWQHDPSIQAICNGWPQGINSQRSRRRSVGFEMDKDLHDEVVRNFIADDLDEQMKKIVKPA